MRTIHKFELKADGNPTKVETSVTNKVLSVGHDRNGKACVWIECHDGWQGPKTEMLFYVIGTGHEIPHNAKFVGTIFELPFVWHIYRQL